MACTSRGFSSWTIARLPTIARLRNPAAPVYPRGLTFLGDVDGDADDFLVDVSARARRGLRAIFSCCEGFTAETDLLQWMRAHQVPAAAVYVNWRGRTARQVREDAALRDALERHVKRLTPEIERLTPRQVHERLRDLVMVDVRAGRLTLSTDAPTPMGWRIANLLHLASLPAVILILLLTLLLVPRIALLAVIAVAGWRSCVFECWSRRIRSCARARQPSPWRSWRYSRITT